MIIPGSQIGHGISKADSHLSLLHSRKGHHAPSVIHGDFVDGHAPHTAYIYPNLQVNYFRKFLFRN